MKNSAFILALSLLSPLASCQKVAEQDYEVHATVIHEDGSPVEGAKLVALALKLKQEHPIPIAEPERTNIVETDHRGISILKYKSIPTPSGGVAIGKNGYYGSSFPNVIWEPIGAFDDGMWKAEIKAILKPVKNPIPMYAYDNRGGMERVANIPEIGKEYGFDLMLAEALPPLGNGKTADFTFLVEGGYEKTGSYDMRLEISFSSPQDGVVEFMTPQRTGMREPHMPGSQLLSGHLAPENGYVSEITRTIRRSSLAKPPEKNDNIHRNFYFRTRTRLDSNGKIISANYGKIYGDFHFMGANSEWGYIATLALIATYFNPTPNDRNVEFDPKRNLNPSGNVQRP